MESTFISTRSENRYIHLCVFSDIQLCLYICIYVSPKVQFCWPVLYTYSIPELKDFQKHLKKKLKLIFPTTTAESAEGAEAGETAEGESLCRTDNTAAMQHLRSVGPLWKFRDVKLSPAQFPLLADREIPIMSHLD